MYTGYTDGFLEVGGMDTQITLTLPDDLYQRATNIADLTGWTVEDAVLVMLEVSLPALIPLVDLNKPVESLTNDHLLALTNLQMSSEYDTRHSSLLYQQQSGTMSPVGCSDCLASRSTPHRTRSKPNASRRAPFVTSSL